jgi:hypothetical protein
MFNFTFNEGVAEIRADDYIVVSQPFQPTFQGPRPWDNEATALEWMRSSFPQYFVPDNITPDENSEQEGN